MERTHVALPTALLILLVAAIPASAHHSFAAVFDVNQPVTVKGVVTEVRLENPHSWFFIDVKDASGKVEKWAFEGSTPTSLLRSGVKPSDDLKKQRHATPARPTRDILQYLLDHARLDDWQAAKGRWQAAESATAQANAVHRQFVTDYVLREPISADEDVKLCSAGKPGQ